MKDNATIVIAEDQDLVKELLVPALKIERINTIGEAADGLELLELLKTKNPDIILLDIDMPKMNGKQALTIIKELYPRLKIIILTSYLEEDIRLDFIKSGVDGFLTKNEKFEEIVKTIFDVKNNKHVHRPPSKKGKFTARELQMIPMMCAGKTMKEIANKLKITEKTAEGHRQRLYKKTATTSIAMFTEHCRSLGLNFLGEN
jgi:two-component system, NarL family, response regulator